MGSGPGFSFSWRAFRPLSRRRFALGSADVFSIIIVFLALEGAGAREKAVSTRADSLIARGNSDLQWQAREFLEKNSGADGWGDEFLEKNSGAVG